MGENTLFAKSTATPGAALQFPEWQSDYQAVLRETDHQMLFKRIEVAQAAILGRRDSVMHDPNREAEYQEIQRALEKLTSLKRDVLKFPL